MKRINPITRRKKSEPTAGIGFEKASRFVDFEPIVRSSKLRTLILIERAKRLRERESSTEKVPGKEEEPREKEADYVPLIHVDRDPESWENFFNITRDGGKHKIFVTNNGLRTSSLVFVETYETSMGLYNIPVGDPYPALLNARGYILNLHPGETKWIELEWNPDTTQPSTHLNVQAYDPILDPPYPLNYHPSLFPDFHIKHNGHATARGVP